MDLKNKVVIITGSSSGLGLETAKLLIAEGCSVIINSRDKKELFEAAKKIGAFPIAADISKEKDVKKLANKTVKKYGRIDVWINNVGVWIKHGSVLDLDLKKVHQMFEVNVFGTIYGSREALRVMKPKKEGTIINIISISALSARPGSSSYSASKCAADGFTKSLREEVREDRIKVISVYPGGMKTHFFDEKRPDDYNKYQEPLEVAKRIVSNLKINSPLEELVVRRKV